MTRFAWILCITIGLATACGDVEYDGPGDVDSDGSVVPPPPEPAPGREVAVAAGRLTGGTLIVDVQLGALDQSRTSGGALTATTAAPLNP